MAVVVVDYGMGNIASVANMIRKVGGSAEVSGELNRIQAATKVILPGVGSFDHGVIQLQTLGIFSAIQKIAKQGVPILGICLGMQLLSKGSEEGKLGGLGVIDAEFKRFSFEGIPPLHVPHVGWNYVSVAKKNSLICDDGSEQRFYFTHSYHAVCNTEADILATTEYGYRFPSAYCRDNVFGVQFHPEKSHRFGMAVIKNFLEL
ncbi:MAG: imidazole glycerol phosphate synthase subunit HisH [Proteobacteria bacterium]|nr:imidazole glycerol phosphate synthase subunit HisH [Pseudomonadota bacterium]